MEDVIKRFLSVQSGQSSHSFGEVFLDFCNGSGNHNYSGYGFGSGPGHGDDHCHGYGHGSGSGCGYVDGSGSELSIESTDYNNDIKQYNNQPVYLIDDVQTLIDSVHGNYAKCRVINNDLTISHCFVAKVGNFFAHGDTLRQAFNDATKKYNQNKPIEERITDFIKQYPSLDSIAEHSDLYRWHNILTGSCAFGRDQFAKEHNLDKDHGTMTVRDFIDLTKHSHGGCYIMQLAKAY